MKHKPKHQNLTAEEQDKIFQRISENRNDSWKPIITKAPRYSTGLKNNWWWKSKEDR